MQKKTALLFLPLIVCSFVLSGCLGLFDTIGTPKYTAAIIQLEGSENDTWRRGIISGFEKRGLIIGDNLRLEYEICKPADAAQTARKLYESEPGIFIAIGDEAAQAAFNQALGRTPVVFANVSDPVYAGLCKPSGEMLKNVYGIASCPSPALRAEILKNIFPSASSAVSVYDASEPIFKELAEKLESEKLAGLSVFCLPIYEEQDFNEIFPTEPPQKFDCFFISNDNANVRNFSQIVKFCSQEKILAVGTTADMARAGCAISVSTSTALEIEDAADICSKILYNLSQKQETLIFSTRITLYYNPVVLRRLSIEMPEKMENISEIIDVVS